MRVAFLIIFTLALSGIYATVDMICFVEKGNMHFQFRSAYEEAEFATKLDMLGDLEERLLNAKRYNSEPVYIYFGRMRYRQDTLARLGYGSFIYWNSSTTNNVTKKGFKIYLSDRDFNIRKILNLINAAFMNINDIKAKQKYFHLSEKNGDEDSAQSISFSLVSQYLTSTDPTVDQLLNEKTYRYLKRGDKNGEIDYYFQNNKYHFYNTWKSVPEGIHIPEGKIYDEDILVLDDVHEIIGSKDDGHIVFINDSVFYYIPEFMGSSKGPFTIAGIPYFGRSPIDKYEHVNVPLERFTLFYDKYWEKRKALFIPDSNMVISYFDTVENNFILGLLTKKEVETVKVKKSNTLNITLVILVLSLSLNVLLYSRKRK